MIKDKQRIVNELRGAFDAVLIMSITVSKRASTKTWNKILKHFRLDNNLKDDESFCELELVDAQKIAKEHPKTFTAPKMIDLYLISKGDYIKVCLNDLERIWVLVESIDGMTKTIKGVIANDPIFTIIHGMKDKSPITVKFNEVFLCNVKQAKE